MLIPAGAQWEWGGVHPLHGCVWCVCVCGFFFSSKMTCNGHLNQTHSHSQLRGWVGLGERGCVRSDLCYKSCYKHMTGFWIQGPSRWVFVVSPSPPLSLLGHPSGANILSDSWNVVRPAHAWLHLTLQFWCESATSVPVPPSSRAFGVRVDEPVAAADDVLCDAGRCNPPSDLWPLSNGMPGAQAFSTSHYLSSK